MRRAEGEEDIMGVNIFGSTDERWLENMSQATLENNCKEKNIGKGKQARNRLRERGNNSLVKQQKPYAA